jgi:flagellar basal body-associated protein FliL
MAKEVAAPVEPVKEGKGGGKGGLIKIIIVVVAVLALAGGGYWGWSIYKKKKAAKAAALAVTEGKGDPKDAHETKKEGDEDEDDEHGKAAEKGAAGASVLILKPIVNLESQRKNAFLKCELHLIFRDPELGKLAAGDKPTVENSTIRAMVLEALSGKTVEEAADPETRELVRKDLKERLNEKFAPKLKPGEKEDPKHKKTKKPVKEILVVDWAIAQ